MRHFVCLAALLAIVGLACGSANADWVDMGLSNGDFSTPGTLPIGSSVAVSRYDGTDDNDPFSIPPNQPKLFQDWRALGTALSGTAYSVAGGEARLNRGGALGKNQTPVLVHDALKRPNNAYWTIESTVYKLEFDTRYSSYSYKAYASIYYGDTDRGNLSTWKAGSYFNFPQPPVWYPTAQYQMPLTTSMQTLTLYWDNTGSLASDPGYVAPWGAGAMPANTAIVYTGAGNQRLGEHIRVGFVGSQYGTGAGSTTNLYVDNVELNYWVEVPEPATMSLLCLGAIPLLRRRRP